MKNATTDPWLEYLALSEWDRMALVADRIRCWPDGALAEFLRLGLLRETTPLEALDCSECPGETCDILYLKNPVTGLVDIRLLCPHCGPVEMTLDELRRWSIEWLALVQFLAEGLSLRGGYAEVVPNRLWQLGKAYWSGRPASVFVGRALHRSDVPDLISHMSHFTNALFLVPKRTPTVPFGHPVVTLDLVCNWNGTGLEFDAEFVAAQRKPPVADPPARPKKEGNRTAVRQRLRAELDAHLAASGEHVQAALQFGREPTLLPFPNFDELARRCDTSKATVSRCLRDDAELRDLCLAARDLYRQLGPGGRVSRESIS